MRRDDPRDRAMRATHCRTCGARLPSDRLSVAREERATNTDRGHQLAARLESDRCLACSEPCSAPRGINGALCRPEGQKHGNARVSS